MKLNRNDLLYVISQTRNIVKENREDTLNLLKQQKQELIDEYNEEVVPDVVKILNCKSDYALNLIKGNVDLDSKEYHNGFSFIRPKIQEYQKMYKDIVDKIHNIKQQIVNMSSSSDDVDTEIDSIDNSERLRRRRREQSNAIANDNMEDRGLNMATNRMMAEKLDPQFFFDLIKEILPSISGSLSKEHFSIYHDEINGFFENLLTSDEANILWNNIDNSMVKEGILYESDDEEENGLVPVGNNLPATYNSGIVPANNDENETIDIDYEDVSDDKTSIASELVKAIGRGGLEKLEKIRKKIAQERGYKFVKKYIDYLDDIKSQLPRGSQEYKYVSDESDKFIGKLFGEMMDVRNPKNRKFFDDVLNMLYSKMDFSDDISGKDLFNMVYGEPEEDEVMLNKSVYALKYGLNLFICEYMYCFQTLLLSYLAMSCPFVFDKFILMSNLHTVEEFEEQLEKNGAMPYKSTKLLLQQVEKGNLSIEEMFALGESMQGNDNSLDNLINPTEDEVNAEAGISSREDNEMADDVSDEINEAIGNRRKITELMLENIIYHRFKQQAKMKLMESYIKSVRKKNRRGRR